MLTMSDLDIIGGEVDDWAEEGYFSAIQRAINSLSAWRLQGSVGRTMMAAITGGYCMLGENSTSDAWGNRIPSRTEVKDGTKGSRSYVAERMGEDWAHMMDEA